MPAEYELPVTRRGVQERNQKRQHLYRTNSEFGVYLRSDQVLGLSGEVHGNLAFLDCVPAGQLRSLRLQASEINETGIARLKRYDGLRELDLMVDRVDNMDAVLAAVPRLRYLSVWSPLNLDRATAPDKHYFSNDQFRLFEKLPDLRAVHVNSRLVTDEGIRLAAKLPKLEALGILGTRLITNDGFAALTKAKGLKEITIEAGPRCTDEGVKHLLKLEHLEWVEIYGMAAIDEATIDALKSRFPRVDIQFKPLVNP
jgi:hypothetical protein